MTQTSVDIRSRVLKGLVWVVASQAGLQLTRAVVAIIVARLLTPAEYGLAALALVFASLVLVFSDMAMGAALIQRKVLSAVDRDTAFWVTLGGGVLFSILGLALAGPIAALYGEPDAKPLLMALSSTFVITALGATQQSLMLRDMDFRRIEVLPMLGAVAGGIAGVTLALMDAGAWAIISQQLATSAATTLLVWVRSEWRPRLAFSKQSLRDLGGFSAYMLGHRMLFYLQSNADRFLIGRFLGTPALGAYAVGYNTIVQPAAPARRAAPARVLARVLADPGRARADRRHVGAREPDARLDHRPRPRRADRRRARLRAASSSGSTGSPRSRSSRCSPSSGIVQALQSLHMDILMARGRGKTILRFSIVMCSAHMIAFASGLHWGVDRRRGLLRDLDHVRGDVPDRARGARARRLAARLPPRDLRRVPGRARHVRRRARWCGSRSSTPRSPRRCVCRSASSPVRASTASCCCGASPTAARRARDHRSPPQRLAPPAPCRRAPKR